MGGPSQHGQHNKPHKPGRRAGASAREKHKTKKEAAGAPRISAKAANRNNKLERAQASKQHRQAKRAELLDARRRQTAPVVVSVLPLSDAADAAALWTGLLAAAGADADSSSSSSSRRLCTIDANGRRRVRLTLLPAPADRHDPLAIVDLAKAAEVLLLLLPGHESTAAVDAAGVNALAILRAMGLPSTVAVVQSHCADHSSNSKQEAVQDDDHMELGGDDAAVVAAVTAAGSKGSSADLRRRSTAKKRAEKALQQHLAGDIKLVLSDNQQDMQQLLRTLADNMPQLPVWRRQRPYIMVQQASFIPSQPPQQQQDLIPPQHQQQHMGTLFLTGYVRAQGLSANQLVTVPGAGDFRILQIQGTDSPTAGVQHHRLEKGSRDEVEMWDIGTEGRDGVVIAAPDPEEQEPLVRENQPDPLAGEQTWPTEDELAAAAAANAGAKKMRKRNLPAGTSEYQAAWILDDDDDDSDSGASEDSEDGMADAPSLVDDTHMLSDDYAATEGGDGADTDNMLVADDEDEEQAAAERLREELKAKRRAEAEDAEFPDEVDTPQDVSARQRFAKYRGLKSFRSSPWDAREGLPAEYGRVFAFENFKRTAKRAHEAAARATNHTDRSSVPPGSWVRLVLADVPAAAAAAVIQRTAAATGSPAADEHSMPVEDGTIAAASGPSAAVPLVVYGLLQHEAKLSVVNFSLKKVSSYTETIKSKEDLLFVSGLRSFMAQPVLSDDGQGSDKYKMDRFLQPGKTAVGSVYAPISYPPLPLLAFKVLPGQTPQLAATGAFRSVDPDRIVVKKIVLSGYPVRVHKTRAVVRLMFFNPDDVRWFKPVELWTKSGRRGRITEPLGTHGAFKARFDGPVQQRDSVCMSLYKRVFPKWPTVPNAVQQQQQPGECAALGMTSFA